AGCTSETETIIETNDDIINQTGTTAQMSQFGSDFFVINTDLGQRFHPTNLPYDFKRVELRVLFSGKTGEIPPNVRLAAIPLVLSRIEIDIK
ncbi:MAG: hypothetical protein HY707_05445, partial [Ignavibacteriae bacterium]|nr:hypothetical protein [Ignavibacteriota bacterium]